MPSLQLRNPFGKSNRHASQTFIAHTTINDKFYAHPNPSKPVIALMMDGCDVRHIDESLSQKMPYLHSLVTPLGFNKLGKGYMCPVSTVFPTCSRVNQISIVTGMTPNGHGIVGDYCFERDMNSNGTDLSFNDITESDALFADSILSELSHDNVTVLLMTLNEEYREQLSYSFHPNSTSLSLELLVKYANKIANNIVDDNGLNTPLIEYILNDNTIFDQLKELSIYFNNVNGILKDEKGECGLFLLEIMKKIIENTNIETPQLSYIALSPATIQYYHRFNSPQIMEYLQKIDKYLRVFDVNECLFGITSSHGTNHKFGAKGDLHIINLEKKINKFWNEYQLQTNTNFDYNLFELFEYKIVLQKQSILNQNGILYGFAHIHIVRKDVQLQLQSMDHNEELRKCHDKLIFDTLAYFRGLKGIYSSIGLDEASNSLDLPEERIGDIVLLGDMDTIFCDDQYENDNNSIVQDISYRLSHGCLDESTVPLILNERPTDAYLLMLSKGKGRNFNLLDILLNGFDENLQNQCPYSYTPSKYQYVGS